MDVRYSSPNGRKCVYEFLQHCLDCWRLQTGTRLCLAGPLGVICFGALSLRLDLCRYSSTKSLALSRTHCKCPCSVAAVGRKTSLHRQQILDDSAGASDQPLA